MADSSAPSQPSLNQAYETPGNPASKEPVEESRSAINSQSKPSSAPNDHRVPTTQTTTPTESSLARGIHGAPPGEEAHGRSQADVDRSNELDAEQMGAPGEGKVVDAVQRKPGASGNEPGLENDLDRKREEQAPLREEVQGEGGEGQGGVDVQGVLESKKSQGA